MIRSERGFTLLELLVAVSLLALLMTLLVSGLRTGTQHLARADERLERSARSVLVQHFLRAELADARPLSDPGAGATAAIAFDGRPDGLTFVGPTPASAASGGLQMLSVDAGEGEIVAHWRAFGAPAGTVATSPRQSVLLDHVRHADFSYFGAVKEGEAPNWHSSWESKADLPLLVRLTVEFADGAVMPELIVAIQLSSGGSEATPQRQQ